MSKKRLVGTKGSESLRIMVLAALLVGLVASLPALAFADGEHHSGDDWVAWTQDDALPTEAGKKYYLTQDVELGDTWDVPAGEITLDLNGQRVELAENKEGSLAKVSDGETLTLVDCETSGAFQGGTGIEGKGGAVLVETNGTFVLDGAKITDSEAKEFGEGDTKTSQGGGVYVAGTFTMNDGTVESCKATQGGGVYVADGGTFSMSGGTADKATQGADVYVSGSGTFEVQGSKVKVTDAALAGEAKIKVTGKLEESKEGEDNTEAASIGVTKLDSEGKACAGVFTTGYKDAKNTADPSKYFTSKDAQFKVFKSSDGNEAQLAKEVTLSFDGNGATAGSMAPITGAENSKLDLPACGFQRNEHTFTGWNTKADGTGTSYTDGQKNVELKQQTLYAQWKKNPEVYTVSFNANGGDGAPISDKKVEEDKKLKLPTNDFTRTGYTANGWNTTSNGKGTHYKNGASISIKANTTLYAQWKKNPVEKYTISFDANGGTGTMGNQTATKGKELKLTPCTFTRVECTFKEWNTKPDGTGRSYADGASATFTADTKLYARWNIPTISFNKNAENATGTMEPQQAQWGEYKNKNGEMQMGWVVVLNPNSFSRPGYTFDKWRTEIGGNVFDVPDGAKIAIHGNYTLYAQWVENGKEGGVKTRIVNNTELGISTVTVANGTRIDTLQRAAEGMVADDAEKAQGVLFTLTASPRTLDGLADAEKTVINDFIGKYRLISGAVFDLSLSKQVGDGAATAVTSTPQKVSLTIQVPSSLGSTSATVRRTFYLLRVHDGQVAALAGSTSSSLAAQTDAFSTYVIAYRDGTSTSGGGSNTGSSTRYSSGTGTATRTSSSSTSSSTRQATANTGDSSVSTIAIVAIAAVGVGVLVLGIMNKRKHRG